MNSRKRGVAAGKSAAGTGLRRRAILLAATAATALLVGSGTALAGDLSCRLEPWGDSVCSDEFTPSADSDTIIGSIVGDIISGEGGNDRLYGNGDDDRINGGEGNDLITGNEGPDQIFAGDGDDDVDGGVGVDEIGGSAGNDVLKGQEDDDKVWAGEGDDTIHAGEGADFSYGDGGNDYVYGGDGDDDFSGKWGNDRLFGEGGNDTFSGGDEAGNDLMDGGSGNDHLSFYRAAGGDFYPQEDKGYDEFLGGYDDDTIYAKDGNLFPAPVPSVGELVDCGPGYDKAYIDYDPKSPDSYKSDRTVNCEVVVKPHSPPPPPPTNTRPIITDCFPADEARIKDKTPRIRCTVTDSQTEMQESAIRLYLDGRAKSFTYSSATDGLSYASRPLKPGRHTVKVTAKDPESLTATKSLSFYVKR